MSDDASKTGPVTDRVRAAVESRIERLESLLTLAVRQSEAIRRKHFGGLERMLTERAAIVESLVSDAAAFEAMAREVAGTMDERLLERLGVAERLASEIEARDAESLELARTEGERSRIELEKITLAGRVGRAYRSGNPESAGHRRDLADQA